MSDQERLREIAADLSGLVASSPIVEGEIERWSAAASDTYKRLLDNYPDVRLPIQVMHYVHDADIRVRDAEYRESQNAAMGIIIAELERGVVPPSRGLTISFGFRGVALFMCAACLLILLVVRSCA